MSRTIDTLHRIVDFLIDEAAEDICAICAYARKGTPPVADEKDPCVWRRTNGTAACRNGIIEHFEEDEE